MGPWSDPSGGSKRPAGRAYCGRRSREAMSAHTIHSTARRRPARRDRLLGTPAATTRSAPLALAAGYYATAQLGEALAFPNAPVSALWLPNALVMGALLLAPRRYWWFYLLAVLPAHLHRAAAAARRDDRPGRDPVRAELRDGADRRAGAHAFRAGHASFRPRTAGLAAGVLRRSGRAVHDQPHHGGRVSHHRRGPQASG